MWTSQRFCSHTNRYNCRFKSQLHNCCKSQRRLPEAARKPRYHNSLILQSKTPRRRKHLLLQNSQWFTSGDTVSTRLATAYFSHHLISIGPSVFYTKEEGIFRNFCVHREKEGQPAFKNNGRYQNLDQIST